MISIDVESVLIFSCRCFRSAARRLRAGCGMVVWVCLLTLMGQASSTMAQVVANTNQIVGTFELTNTNPDLLADLASEGIYSGAIHAVSSGVTPELSHQTDLVLDSPLGGSFEMTAEAGPLGDGIAYTLYPQLRFQDLESGLFMPIGAPSPPAEMTGPLFEEPAPDQSVMIELCVGRVDIRFEDTLGQSVSVTSSRVEFIQEENGQRQLDWRGWSNGGQELRAYVDGDATVEHALTIYYRTGSDIFTDLIQYEKTVRVNVGCDQIVPVVVVVPTGNQGGELGRIIGRVDMLRETESHVGLFRASDGPFRNERQDLLELPFPQEFELNNLLPSSATDPSEGYQVRALPLFIRAGERFEVFYSPALDFANGGQVMVGAGETVDLGETFVIDPGYVGGALRLAGPTVAAGSQESCLSTLYRDSERGNDGIPDNEFLTGGSTVYALGSRTLAPGATYSAIGGAALAEFVGALDPVSSEFLGNYELALGGLLGEATYWDVDRLNLRFVERETPQDPDGFFHASAEITDLTRNLFLVEPRQSQDAPFTYCMSQVNLGFRSSQVDFFDPFVELAGAFQGPDFMGTGVNYSVSGNGYGTPVNVETASSRGQVSLCLPEGQYSFTPSIQAMNPNGSVSTTELPPVDLTVGCRQVIDVTSSLQLAVDSVAACTSSPDLEISGTVTSSTPVTRIEASVGDTSTTLCSDCGENPSFTFNAQLEACDNSIQVEAENLFGDLATALVSTRFDDEGPVLGACPDLDFQVAPGSSGSTVDYGFGDTVNDLCDGDRPVVCDVSSGTFFPLGETTVSCSTSDQCGNVSSCQFTVRVRDGIQDGDICEEDAFETDFLDPSWTLSFLGDADQGNAELIDGRLHLSGNGTSLYHGDDNAAFLHRPAVGDFRLEVDVEDFPVDAGGTVRKAALMVRSGTGPRDPRVMVTYVPHLPDPPTTALQFDVRDASGNAFELAGIDLGVELPVRLSIERRGDVFSVGYSTDGGVTWVAPEGDFGGVLEVAMGETVQAGVAVSSYDANAQLTAAFDDISLCRPDTTPVVPEDPPICEPDLALDVVVLLDMSSSMSHSFGGEARFEAARSMSHDVLDLLQADMSDHRVALVTFGGPLGGPFTEVLSDIGDGAFSQDFEALRAALDGMEQPTVQPLRPTAMAHGLETVFDLLMSQGDAGRRPVLVWATDGVPAIDSDGNGPGMEGPTGYGLNEVQAIRLQDDGGFFPRGIVRHFGDFNTAFGTRDGRVLADVMFGLERLEDAFGDLLIYGLALQGDGVDLGTFNEDLLAYGAYLSSTPYYSTTDADQLRGALASLFGELACGEPGSALVGDRVWSDLDGDGVQDGVEPGVAGVTVEVLNAADQLVGSAVTDVDGTYQLGPLVPGIYTVRLAESDLLGGAVATHDVDGVDTPNAAIIEVTPWTVLRDIDFGLQPLPEDPLAECLVDLFDGDLDASWTLAGLDGSSASVSTTEGALDLTSDGHAWWGRDGHAFLYQEASGDFRFEVGLEGFPVDAGGQFRKAGITVRSSLDPTAPRLMAAIVPQFPNPTRSVLQHGVRDVQDGGSRDLADPLFAEVPVRLAIERRGNILNVFHSFNDGVTWVQPIDGGTLTLDLGETVYVGLGTASYDDTVSLTARFDDALLCPLTEP